MSKRLTALRRELESLRGQFLPQPFEPLNQYKDGARVQAYTRAYLVLCHAEIESYLEDWARDIARASESLWVTKGRVTPPLTFLVSSIGERLTIHASLAAKGAADGPQQLATAIRKRLYPAYYTRIKENHGIKEKNVLGMFLPLGAPASAFTPTLMPNLEALGAARGTHAHNAARAVKTVLSPEDEYQRIQTVLADLAAFDSWLVSYKKKVR